MSGPRRLAHLQSPRVPTSPAQLWAWSMTSWSRGQNTSLHNTLLFIFPSTCLLFVLSKQSSYLPIIGQVDCYQDCCVISHPRGFLGNVPPCLTRYLVLLARSVMAQFQARLAELISIPPPQPPHRTKQLLTLQETASGPCISMRGQPDATFFLDPQTTPPPHHSALRWPVLQGCSPASALLH